MPIIKSSSDLQRNFSTISDLAHETGEPIYITRNGEASLVVLDVEVYERTLKLEQEIHDYEMEILDIVMESEADFEAGRGMSLDQIRQRRAEMLLESEEEIRAGHTTSYESYRQRRMGLADEEVVAA